MAQLESMVSLALLHGGVRTAALCVVGVIGATSPHGGVVHVGQPVSNLLVLFCLRHGGHDGSHRLLLIVEPLCCITQGSGCSARPQFA